MGWLDIVLRLGSAMLIGGAIGLNRDLHHKPTGMRTLGLVALGSTLAVLAAAVGLQYLSFAVFDRSVAGMFFVYLAAILVAAWCGYMPGVTVVILVAAGVPFLFRPDSRSTTSTQAP